MMTKLFTIAALLICAFTASGCSVFGYSGVEIAPYKVISNSEPFEVRHYHKLILVTTPMESLDEDKTPFYKLFDYISGENSKTQDISMTAPVFMDQLDGKTETMSFVLPDSFSLENAPTPQDNSVKIEEIKHTTFAVITFSGSLNRENIDENQAKLEKWIAENGYETTGAAKAAGYNPPFTIPAFRRNEIFIPILGK